MKTSTQYMLTAALAFTTLNLNSMHSIKKHKQLGLSSRAKNEIYHYVSANDSTLEYFFLDNTEQEDARSQSAPPIFNMEDETPQPFRSQSAPAKADDFKPIPAETNNNYDQFNYITSDTPTEESIMMTKDRYSMSAPIKINDPLTKQPTQKLAGQKIVLLTNWYKK